jgi:RNA polymerase sigma factor (sigma-70 family)
MRSAGSFDDRYEDSDGSRFDAIVEDYLRDQERHAEEAEEADGERKRAVSLVHWAIRQVANDRYRAVLELTYIHKLTGEQIAQRLDITLANVYQRRKRGLNELEKILRDNRS